MVLNKDFVCFYFFIIQCENTHSEIRLTKWVFFVVVFIKPASGFLTVDDIISLYPLCYIYSFNVDGEALSFLMSIV